MQHDLGTFQVSWFKSHDFKGLEIQLSLTVSELRFWTSPTLSLDLVSKMQDLHQVLPCFGTLLIHSLSLLSISCFPIYPAFSRVPSVHPLVQIWLFVPVEHCLPYDLAPVCHRLGLQPGQGAQGCLWLGGSEGLSTAVGCGENCAWSSSGVCWEAVLILLQSGKCWVRYAGTNGVRQQTMPWRSSSVPRENVAPGEDGLGSNPGSVLSEFVTIAKLLNCLVPQFLTL